ncbi:TPA: RusA family crossover junction endodeoxyribonuclease [Escherichia coli]|uniref:RusA family crossover junction endodeoxyribonuclease n=1 Tax=Escherichia coli TaxID=562 RepID=UPI001389A7D1|nr:RusA family crossover junction endodeoxyribonuclease [Escherichia coli]MCI2823349.1 RusA family crossover junction endodeoxyribonuclease [Escherichia coli]NDI92601.1 RusA family crossover junction endodeoxyribonuclease [Escherichia coli]
MLIDLVLPYPPTVNTYWRRRGSTYFISEEGKRYRRRDLDNILKAPLDALTHAGLLIDDEQFDEINIVRGLPVPGGRLGIKITELECA